MVIETEKVVYKIESVKNRHIDKVKACKIKTIDENEKEDDEEAKEKED